MLATDFPASYTVSGFVLERRAISEIGVTAAANLPPLLGHYYVLLLDPLGRRFDENISDL